MSNEYSQRIRKIIEELELFNERLDAANKRIEELWPRFIKSYDDNLAELVLEAINGEQENKQWEEK